MKKFFIIVLGICSVIALAAARSTRSSKNDIARNLMIFNSLMKELQMNYVDTIDSESLVRTAIDAMLSHIDPYTEYYPYEETENLTSISTGKYSGIGSYIRNRKGRVISTEPVYGSPSRLAGMRHGDIILEVDGTPVTTSDQATKLLRGEKGTNVHVKLQRPYVTDSIIELDITRDDVELGAPVPYYGIDSTGVGYIRLTTFNEKSASQVREAVNALMADPELKGIVLDLRGNGGGILEGAVQIASLFVPKGTEIVRHSGFGGKNLKIYKTTSAPIAPDMPLAVLTDGNTASSAEIVAGSMQDLDRAVIIGDRSFGKGLVQNSRPLPYDGLMKVTVARYYIPSGRLIQAIDYSHRNPDGSVSRIPDSLTKVWTTVRGREVRDGGGITPDVTVKDTTGMNRLMYNIITDDWAFDFANRYRAMHDTIAPASVWVADDSLFTEFKKFIDPARFKYDRATEQGIDYLRQAARLEGYMNDSVAAQLDLLAAMLRHDLEKDLEFNKENILDVLDSEISSRYYDEGGEVMRGIRKDMVLDSARAVLLDRPRYNNILRISNDNNQ